MIIGIDASRANSHDRTGTEWYSYELIRRWPRLQPELTFRLYLREAPLPDMLNLGANVEYRVLGWPPKFLWSLLRLSWEMLWHQPEVLFVPAHTFPLIAPKKCFFTCHDVGFESNPELYSHKPIGPGGRWLGIIIRFMTLGKFGNSELDYHRYSIRRALQRAQNVFTISEFSKKEIIRFFHAPADKIQVVKLGIKSEYFNAAPRPDSKAVLRNFGLDKQFILFIGRLEIKKNIINLVLAYNEFIKAHPLGAELVLIGDPGTGFDQAQKIITAHELHSKIHILPWQPTDNLIKILSCARAFVFISRYEGFGLPAVESMAAGIPVLASTAASLPEVCGSAALYVDPDDIAGISEKIHQITTDDALRQRLIQAGQKQASGFSWDNCALQTLDAIIKNV